MALTMVHIITIIIDNQIISLTSPDNRAMKAVSLQSNEPEKSCQYC